jgi:hypothetical protein
MNTLQPVQSLQPPPLVSSNGISMNPAIQSPHNPILTLPTKLARREEILKKHPIPDHWKAPDSSSSPMRNVVFNALCLMAFGHAGLDPIWAGIVLEEEGDESVWAEGIRQTCERLGAIIVVVSLRIRLCFL